MKRKTLLILCLFAPVLAYGFEETFQIADDLPYWTIASQLANLSLLIAIIYFWQRKNIAQVFKDKKDEFLSSVNAANRSKADAEKKLKEVSERFEMMKATFVNQVNEAKKNAEEAYRMQLADARNSAEKVKSMAQTSLDFEVQKQIEILRVETFQKSARVAEKELEQKLTPAQLKTWNSRFATAEGAQ